MNALAQAPTRVIDIQKGLRELGRLRMGYSEPAANGRKTPKKSGFWILTSSDRHALERAAAVFGGTVEDWPDKDTDHAFRLVTKATEIPILIAPTAATQSYELWSGGGCTRRCNGQTDRLNDCPCQCPAGHKERSELAKSGKACKLTTRVGFIIPSIPDVGVWRLETHGYYAAVELPSTTDMLGAMAENGLRVPAFVAIEIRTSKRDKQTRKYPVPVIRLRSSMNELLALNGQDVPHAPAIGARSASAPELPPASQQAIESGGAGGAFLDEGQLMAALHLDDAQYHEIDNQLGDMVLRGGPTTVEFLRLCVGAGCSDYAAVAAQLKAVEGTL